MATRFGLWAGVVLCSLMLLGGCGRKTSTPTDASVGDGYPWPPPPPTDGGPINPEWGWWPPDLPRPWPVDGPPWKGDHYPKWPDKYTPPWPDLPKPGLVEKMTCLFSGSTTTQQCVSSKGPSCSGISSCTVMVGGVYGEKVDWKSTCGGYYTSIMDGKDEVAMWPCPVNPPPPVSEAVTCVFSGAGLSVQSCWSPYGGCSGTGSCIAKLTGPKGQSVTWSSSCGGSSKLTILDGINDTITFACGGPVSETVTCLFPGSTTMQTCSSSKGPGCSGTSSCMVTVTGILGEKLDWKSTCGGYLTSIIDGKSESLTFPCTPSTVSETVTCWFKGSKTFQQCYSSAGSCQGLLGCTVLVKGPMGQPVQWKSSCGGYANTITDGKDEPANFYCGPASDAGPPPPPWPTDMAMPPWP